MGFKRKRSNDSDSKTDSSRYSKGSRFSYGKKSQTRSQSTVPTFRDQAHAEAHYGQEIESATEFHQLQRLEKRYGERLHGWLAEGMPKKAMGHPQEMADFRIQRAVEGTDTSREDVPEPVLEVVGDEGQPLPDRIQRSLEDRMDADFSDVRIQIGPKAAQACDAIGARAFTCGNKIAFNTGEYDTRSPEGQHLLAHELAHVKQQTGGAAISMMPQEGVELEIDPDPQLEREAEEMATQVMSGGELGIQRFPDTQFHIQRMKDRVGMATQWSADQLKKVFGETDDGEVDLNSKKVVKDGVVWGFGASLFTNPEAALATGGIVAAKELVDQASAKQIERLLESLDEGTVQYRLLLRALANKGLAKVFGDDETGETRFDDSE